MTADQRIQIYYILSEQWPGEYSYDHGNERILEVANAGSKQWEELDDESAISRLNDAIGACEGRARRGRRLLSML